jgi:DNA-binding LytR/AlgR family response regulator
MKRKRTYIIVDDDILAHKSFSILIANYDFLECIGSCNNAFEAVNMLVEKKPDLLFLDIEMPGMSGLDLLEIIDKSIKVIVTSCYPAYAEDTYLNNQVVGFLKKPIRPERLCKTLSNVMLLFNLEEIKPENPSKTKHPISFLHVKGSLKEEKIYLNDVLLCKVNGNSVDIVRDDNKCFKYNASLKKMSEILPFPDFIRINKSSIISIHKIKHRKGNEIELIDNKIFTIGDDFIQQFEPAYNEIIES